MLSGLIMVDYSTGHAVLLSCSVTDAAVATLKEDGGHTPRLCVHLKTRFRVTSDFDVHGVYELPCIEAEESLLNIF
jgi:hypothetical protein